jgi:hypothetical protein
MQTIFKKSRKLPLIGMLYKGKPQQLVSLKTTVHIVGRIKEAVLLCHRGLLSNLFQSIALTFV